MSFEAKQGFCLVGGVGVEHGVVVGVVQAVGVVVVTCTRLPGYTRTLAALSRFQLMQEFHGDFFLGSDFRFVLLVSVDQHAIVVFDDLS